MDKLDRATIQRLASHNEGPCVSLFLETHPTGKDGEQDAIRLKNLLSEAENKLAGHWMRAPEARDLVAQAAELPRDPSFWQSRSKGLAIFMTPNLFNVYRLPVALAEHVAVNNRFRVRPLLPLLEQTLSFFLLTISENQVALYSVDEQTIDKIDAPGMPANLKESLNVVSGDRGSQVHSAMPGLPGKQSAVFHGQGGQPDRTRDDQLAYCAEINKAVSARLGDSNRPLLLGAVERLADLYRQKNSYKYLLPATFTGSHDRDSEHQLREGAWRITQPLLSSEATKVSVRYAELVGTQKVSDEPREVISAAIQGRVDCLVYDPKAELFGECSSAGDNVQVTGNADDVDLVDIAAVETLRHGGTIHAMTDQDIPTNAPLAAIFRF